MSEFKSVREAYVVEGVEAFYSTHANTYSNPHQPYIEALLHNNAYRIDYVRVLDMACGGGEVTNAIKKLGFTETIGSDPFTASLYTAQTGCACLTYQFEDFLLPQTLSDPLLLPPFSAIICSFALHLAPEKMLFSFVHAMWQLSKALIIITPHKRPALEQLSNTMLLFEDSVITERGKKVFLKCYAPTVFYEI